MTAEPVQVIPCEGYGFFVDSLSQPGCYRLVAPDGTCSCPATVARCRHLRAVLDFVETVREAARNHPSGRPTRSTFTAQHPPRTVKSVSG